MELMSDQKEASTRFEAWLNKSSTQTCGLWASAGFGKSWLAKHLIDEIILKNSNYQPIITSMTHSAVEVLTNFVEREVSTLHSFMGWIPVVDKETGEEKLSTPRQRHPHKESHINSDMLIIVDEAGLMGHEELRLLLDELEETGARTLFIGDNKQNYPVTRDNERLCIPAEEQTEVKLELTIPKRVQEGDRIYQLSLAYRAAVDGARQPRLKTALNPDGSGKGVYVVDDIEEAAYKAFQAGLRDGNTRNIKVLAYTNKRCLSLNKKIRSKVLGLKSPIPTVGEEMVANTAIQSSVGDTVLIRNNQKVIVRQVEPTTNYGLDGAFIQFERENGETVEEIVFVPSTPMELNRRLKKLASEAKALKRNGFDDDSKKKWRTFYSLKEACADIRFTYAMTVNKAQGVTLKHALVDLNDINTCRDYEQATRLAYTAVTRATDYVTIEGEITKPYRRSELKEVKYF